MSANRVFWDRALNFVNSCDFCAVMWNPQIPDSAFGDFLLRVVNDLLGSVMIDLSQSAAVEVGIEVSVSLWKGKWTSWSRQLIGAVDCYGMFGNPIPYSDTELESVMFLHDISIQFYTLHIYVFPSASLVLIEDLFFLSCVEAATCKRNLSEMYVGMRAIMSSTELILWSLLKWCMPFWFTSGVKVEQKECMCFYNPIISINIY